MKKTLVLFFLLLSVSSLSAQQMTVSRMEARWRALYQQGVQFLDARDYPEAEKAFQESIDLLSSNDASGSTYHIYSLIKMGEVYAASSQASKQKSIEDRILEVGKAIRPGSKRQAEYLYSLGVYYSETGRFSDAIAKLDEALSNTQLLLDNPDIKAKLLHRKAICVFFSGDTSQAITLAKECVAADDNQTPDYIEALVYYMFQKQQWSQLESLIPQCFVYAREPVLRKFTQSAAKDRANFWSTAGLFFTNYLPYYALQHPSDTLVSYAYDAALFGKGVLLAAENKASELTLNSDDPQLLKQYEHYLELKGKRNRTLDEDFEMEALSNVFVRYQHENKYSFREDFRIGWREVQSRLKDDEIAIEFMTVPGSSGSDEYIALSIKKGQSAPVLTRLASFDRFAEFSVDDIYVTSGMYDLVWGPLEKELDGMRRVYFSPSGVFYKTGIEYLPNEDEINFNAMFEVCRLSSTKEIVLNEKASLHKAVLIGGVNYDTKVSSMASQSPNYQFTPGDHSIPLDSLDLRGATTSGGFAFLEGTMEEVEEISSLFLDSGMPADLYCGDEGSETILKGLTGTDADLLHIATHGFYYADSHLGSSPSPDKLFKDMSLHFTSEDIEPINEDKMLTRSGLILAGANNVIKRIPIPEGVEDGVLYADEISSLNLGNVGLLVLSACQSGLGDINASEGVFGLQRGFKLAGVHSILMSLWKVNDEATSYLMAQLYSNLMDGQSKQSALTNAQWALRIWQDRAFDDPAYWAAFVLLDVID